MFRRSSSPVSYPVSPKLAAKRLPLQPASRRFFSSRARLHPVVLVPVFLAGCFLAPWLSAFAGEPRLPEPVYRPEDYQWRSSDVFAPADAPPLVQHDDYAGAGAAKGGGAAAGARRAVAEAHAARVREDEAEWEWFEPSAADDPDSSASSPSSSSLADLTSTLYTVHSGLLYFRSSPALIPTLPLSRPFPVAPAARALPRGMRAPAPRPRQPDEGLTLPPRTPRDWLAPGELFVRAPGHRKHAVAPKKAAGHAPVPLHAPLPPVRQLHAPARGKLAAEQLRNGLQADGNYVRDGVVFQRAGLNGQNKDARGKVIGANAALAARAKKAGKPFVPGKPAELLEEERRIRVERQKERARQKALEEKPKGGWQLADSAPKVAIAPVGFSDEDDDDLVEPFAEDDGDDSLWSLGDDDEAAGAHAGNDDATEHLLNDDDALLAAVHALSDDELAELSPEELALVHELEAKSAAAARQAAKAEAQAAADAAPARRAWRDAQAELENPALVEARKARAARLRNPPVRQMPKPVFKGVAGEMAERERMNKGLGRKAALRKRSVVEEPVVEEVEEVEVGSTTSEEPPSTSSSATAESTPSPSAPTANLTRRGLFDSSSSSSSRQQPERLHPITHLISRAEEEWDDLLRRQSQTLEQAVEEYKRRYGRNPPVGFDSWWRFAMQNRVILVDEYDQIDNDILPFLSLPPSEMRHRLTALSSDRSLPWHGNSFSLKIRDGAVDVQQGDKGGGDRREDLLDLLSEFSEMLPDLEIRLSEGDEPSVVVSGEARERHERFAREGKVLDISASYEIAEPSGFTPWDSLCRPNSTARRLAESLPVDVPTGNSLKRFVSIEHAQAMDLCEHPDLRPINGFTAWTGPRPHLLYPLFSFTKTSSHADLLMPYLTSDFYAEIGRDPLWEQKQHNMVLWRGDTTGAWHSKASGWRQTQRARLVALANAKAGSTSFHLADTSSSPPDALRLSSAPTADLTHHYFDMAYVGAPKQCSEKDTTCKLLQHEMRFDRELLPDEENQYKYVVDVDANYASGKFKRVMSSRSLVFKSTIFTEWWTKRIMPWYHYIPLQSDYSDLVDLAAYFIGAPDGTGSHDAQAKRIAQQGKKWAEEHMRDVDMAAYVFRLYLEYARLLHRDADDLASMDYNP
ncbi:hypothetical protein Rhopal_003536-T1 [Rhodotorula paludigena]|uniref:Glycosyl transferase CAP10 domain-containing protein n=1 Tax=Rhodotorula paludigena TaxID=86838 RepID=A0AAV5GLZ9_9BASI|nr:hypothetical protein Rhopal_003536-T1 [Rhodotorula paludigena]